VPDLRGGACCRPRRVRLLSPPPCSAPPSNACLFRDFFWNRAGIGDIKLGVVLLDASLRCREF
jgi:hypothetical protein